MIDDNPQGVTVPLHPSLKKTTLKDVGTTDILVQYCWCVYIIMASGEGGILQYEPVDSSDPLLSSKHFYELMSSGCI